MLAFMIWISGCDESLPGRRAKAFMSTHTTKSTHRLEIAIKFDAPLIRLNPQRHLQPLTTKNIVFHENGKNNDILEPLFSARLSWQFDVGLFRILRLGQP